MITTGRDGKLLGLVTGTEPWRNRGHARDHGRRDRAPAARPPARRAPEGNPRADRGVPRQPAPDAAPARPRTGTGAHPPGPRSARAGAAREPRAGAGRELGSRYPPPRSRWPERDRGGGGFSRNLEKPPVHSAA